MTKLAATRDSADALAYARADRQQEQANMSKHREASQARQARALDLREAGLTYREIAAQLGCSIEQACVAVLKAENLRDNPGWGISVRLANGLKNLGCDGDDEASVARLAAASGLRRWSALHNCGKRTRAELIEWLARHGLTLAP
jgi:hypothetical protein